MCIRDSIIMSNNIIGGALLQVSANPKLAGLFDTLLGTEGHEAGSTSLVYATRDFYYYHLLNSLSSLFIKGFIRGLRVEEKNY